MKNVQIIIALLNVFKENSLKKNEKTKTKTNKQNILKVTKSAIYINIFPKNLISF